MGFQDRRYDEPEGGGGRFRDALRRMFQEGFFAWAIPIGSVAGIRVRIHLLFVIWIVFELLMSIPHGATGLGFRALSITCLFGLVLLHEFGHCFACRRVGGEANDILLWPLGGLASCNPPHAWKAHLITTLGGPGVNVVLVPVFAGLMLVAGARPDQLIFNPFAPGQMLAVLNFGEWWKIAIFYLYFNNLVLLIFNMVVPMFPMDCARVVQELLWSKMGHRKSMWITVNIGLVVAVAIGIFGITVNQQKLVGLALFGGIMCFNERRRLLMESDSVEYDVGTAAGYGYGPRRPDERAVTTATSRDRGYEAALARQQKQQAERAEVDRVLAKISASGWDSLSWSERKVLERETERRRREGGGDSGSKAVG